MTTTPGLDAYLAARDDRCAHGFAKTQHPYLCSCVADLTKHATITRVDASTPDAIKARIDAAIMRHARTGRVFSANDCREELADIEGSRIGPRFNFLGRTHVLDHVDYVQSTDPGTRHQIKTWRIANTQRSAA